MANKVRIKRQHTEKHPEVVIAPMNGKIRNEIITFLGTCDGDCVLEDYFRFITSLQRKLQLTYEPKYWHNRYTKYVSTHTIDGIEIIRLTRLGRNFFNIVVNG